MKIKYLVLFWLTIACNLSANAELKPNDNQSIVSLISLIKGLENSKKIKYYAIDHLIDSPYVNDFKVNLLSDTVFLKFESFPVDTRGYSIRSLAAWNKHQFVYPYYNWNDGNVMSFNLANSFLSGDTLRMVIPRFFKIVEDSTGIVENFADSEKMPTFARNKFRYTIGY